MTLYTSTYRIYNIGRDLQKYATKSLQIFLKPPTPHSEQRVSAQNMTKIDVCTLL